MTPQPSTSVEVSRADIVGREALALLTRPYITFRSSIWADQAWIEPSGAVPGSYRLQLLRDAGREEPALLALVTPADLATALFADWRFPTIARAVSDVVRASYDAERRSAA